MKTDLNEKLKQYRLEIKIKELIDTLEGCSHSLWEWHKELDDDEQVNDDFFAVVDTIDKLRYQLENGEMTLRKQGGQP